MCVIGRVSVIACTTVVRRRVAVASHRPAGIRTRLVPLAKVRSCSGVPFQPLSSSLRPRWPSLPGASASAPSVIRLVSITTSYSSVDVPPHKASAGDRQMFASRLVNAQAPVREAEGCGRRLRPRHDDARRARRRARLKTVATLPGGTLTVSGRLDGGRQRALCRSRSSAGRASSPAPTARSRSSRRPTRRRPSTSIGSRTGRSPDGQARARSPGPERGQHEHGREHAGLRARGQARGSAATRRDRSRRPGPVRGSERISATSRPASPSSNACQCARRSAATVTVLTETYAYGRPERSKIRSPGAATRTRNGSIRCARSSRSVPSRLKKSLSRSLKTTSTRFRAARVEVAAVGRKAQRRQRAGPRRREALGPAAA